MKSLIAIESCIKDIYKHKAQRDTWIKDLGSFFDYKFFIGGGARTLAMLSDDEITLDVDDSYAALSQKTKAIVQWAFNHGYDFVHKTDTDTLISVPNLFLSPYEKYDYYGGDNADMMPPSLKHLFPSGGIQFCSGGAGYWLNRKAMQYVCQGPDGVLSAAEDVYVAGILKQHGILPKFDLSYRWRPEALLDAKMTTYHLSSARQKKYEPQDMYDGYQKIRELYT